MTTNTESIISTYPGVTVEALRRAVQSVDPGDGAKLIVRGGGSTTPWVVYSGSVPIGALGNLRREIHRGIKDALAR